MSPVLAIKKSVDILDETALVDAIVEASDAAAEAAQTIAAARATLDEKAKEFRKLQSYMGNYVGALKVRGTNRSVMYTFANACSSTSVVQEAAMKADLGEDVFSQLFERVTATSLKPGALEQVKMLLGDKFNDLVEVVETIKPKSEFRQNVHALRHTLSFDQARKIDEVEQRFCNKPAMKVNG